MLKVAKFGGSSMADAGQYQKIRDIIRSDPSRRVVVVSAAGKRSAGDNKITDLLYLCYAHLQYGVSCDGIYQMIRERYGDIHRELGLRVDLEGVLDRLRSQMEQGISRDELVSRGEYLSALLMADYLGFTFVDAAQWLFFHYDGTIDQEKSYAALRALAKDKCVVIPGFYGLMPDGKLRTLTRGGSDITGCAGRGGAGCGCLRKLDGCLRHSDGRSPHRRSSALHRARDLQRAAPAFLQRRAGAA